MEALRNTLSYIGGIVQSTKDSIPVAITAINFLRTQEQETPASIADQTITAYVADAMTNAISSVFTRALQVGSFIPTLQITQPQQ